MGALTAIQVKNARPGRHADGKGLYLYVRDTGSKSWILRLMIDGKRQDLGLGPVEKLSLAQARLKAAEQRSKLKIAAQQDQATVPEAQPLLDVPSFREAAKACHTAIKAGWKNQHHSDSWIASLEMHIFRHIGDDRVDAVTSVMVRDALAPIWLKMPETARRILQRIRTVLDYAHIQGWCPTEANLRSVTRGLPRQPVEENHFAAMPYADVPAFIQRLEARPASAGRDALMFTIFNAVRSGEARLAKWSEFDLDAKTWTIPAKRMKMGKQHIVPLAGPALDILGRRWPLRVGDDGFVFSTHGKKPLSDMTMTKVMRDMGIAEITVHGFRSSFTDWAAERTRFRKEVVDKALAHKLSDSVEAAYRRTDFFEKRRRLMTVWATYLTGRRGLHWRLLRWGLSFFARLRSRL